MSTNPFDALARLKAALNESDRVCGELLATLAEYDSTCAARSVEIKRVADESIASLDALARVARGLS